MWDEEFLYSYDVQKQQPNQNTGGGGSGGGNAPATISEELKIMIATINGEAGGCSSVAWEAVADVIMNRVGKREWTNYDTVTKVIQNSGFDAYTNANAPYNEAMNYLNSRDNSNSRLEMLIAIVNDVYTHNRQDITGGAVLYYSLNAQAQLHQKYPNTYPEVPSWNFSVLDEVTVSGLAGTDDFKFYKYK